MSTTPFKHPWRWKLATLRYFFYLKILLLVIAVTAGGHLVFHKASAQSNGGSLFEDLNPEDVFEISLLLENGAEYHHYRYVNDELKICDVAPPEGQRPCQVDLAALTAQFNSIAVDEYIQSLPASVEWSGPTPTPIMLAVEIKAWNAERDRAYRFKAACSQLPDQPDLAVCVRLDRLDHFNYVLVAANQIASLELPES